jgi:hypothetical protein
MEREFPIGLFFNCRNQPPHCLPFFNRYYHELFLRSRPDLCRGMVRRRVKGTVIKPTSSPDSEPNFYQMEYCGAAIGSFFDYSPTRTSSVKDAGVQSAQADGARSNKSSGAKLIVSGPQKRVNQAYSCQSQASTHKKLDEKNDWTSASASSPEIDGTPRLSSSPLPVPSHKRSQQAARPECLTL